MVSDSPSQPSQSVFQQINSGSLQASSDKIGAQSCSITEQVVENFAQTEYSPLELLWMALELTMQAFLSLPLTAYISFAFSLLFLAFFATSYFSVDKSKELSNKKRRSHTEHKRKRSSKTDGK